MNNNNNNNRSSPQKENLTPGMAMEEEEEEEEEEQKKIKPCKKVVIRYKECLKNHAAAIGGSATDGCGEFMPNGEEGSIEALKCSACNCHRNFHRKQLECDQYCECDCRRNHSNVQQMILSGKSGSARSESDEGGGGGGVGRRPGSDHQKRFRTKFTQDQKEKMLSFAESSGWSLQKLEESVVQHFCQEIGIKRRVLKVWMHNNKLTFAKKNSIHSLT